MLKTHRFARALILLTALWLTPTISAEASAPQCRALFKLSTAPESRAARVERLRKLNRFDKTQGPRHLIVLPSQSLNAELAKGIAGLQFYELRTIWALRYAFEPNTRVTFLTSEPVDPAFLAHLQNSAFANDPHWRERVEFVTVEPTQASLAASLLQQDAVIDGLRERIRPNEETVLMPFLTTPLESKVAEKLDLPILGALVEQAHFGSKSQSKIIFKEAGVDALPSIENIKGNKELTEAIDRLWTSENIRLSGSQVLRLMVKLNEGVSGLGNAVLELPALTSDTDRLRAIKTALKKIQPVGAENAGKNFLARMAEGGGIVEVMLAAKTSPSGQAFIHPDGQVEMLSTHEQILDEKTKQIFMGAKFPADQAAHRRTIADAVSRVGSALYKKGVVGFFAVDFVSDAEGRDLFAIEINLRQGGTTHARQMAEFALGAKFDERTGFLTVNGSPTSYVSSDNVYLTNLKGVETSAVIEALEKRRLLVSTRPGQGTGIMLTMAPLAKRIGKLGIIAYGHSAQEAQAIFDEAKETLAQIK